MRAYSIPYTLSLSLSHNSVVDNRFNLSLVWAFMFIYLLVYVSSLCSAIRPYI